MPEAELEREEKVKLVTVMATASQQKRKGAGME